MTTRRDLLAGAGALALSGCATTCPPPGPGAPTPTLIDAHSHLFNVSDLSATRFLSYVMLRQYPPLEDAARPLGEPENPTLADRVVDAILTLLGAREAPTAEAELTLLSRPVPATPPEDLAADREAAIRRAADLLGEKAQATDDPSQDILRQLIAEAGGAGGPSAARTLSGASEARRSAIARRAFSWEESRRPHGLASRRGLEGLASLYLPGLLDFVLQLKRYRHRLVDELIAIHRRSQHKPLLLTPAMVDFGRWLGQEPDAESSFSAQTRLWQVISRRQGEAAVHGYVGFCPLRQVQFNLGKLADPAFSESPMEVVKTAVLERGFLGVKLYPPMGFRASNNAARGKNDHPMPVEVLDRTFGGSHAAAAKRESGTARLGRLLDESLEELYAFCAREGVPIVAHAGNSLAANCKTGRLGDPYYWGPVVSRMNAPSIMLAHFGDFNARAAGSLQAGATVAWGSACDDAEADDVPFQDTWEAWLVRHMAQAPTLYADISYLSEALSDRTYRSTLEKFRMFTPDELVLLRDRLLFGSDWLMLARERRVSDYSCQVRRLLSDLFDPEGVDAIMHHNFLRYADMSPDNRTFERLARAYGGDSDLRSRLSLACTA